MRAKRFAILGIVALSFLALLVNSVLHGATLAQVIVALAPLVITGGAFGLFVYWSRARSKAQKPGKIWATMASLVAAVIATSVTFGLISPLLGGQSIGPFMAAIIFLAASLFLLISARRRSR